MKAIVAAIAGVVLLACLPCWALEAESLERSLRQGNDALARVLPELDALAGPMSRDVLDGKADLHVFYGMVIARMLYNNCQDTISLLRSSQVQECPALNAALIKRLGDSAGKLEGAAELIAGSLPMAANNRVAILGQAMVRGLQAYLGPLKEFVENPERREM